MPVMAAASRNDGDAVNAMRWLLGWSRHPANKFLEFKAAGHGTDMFAVERGLAARDPRLVRRAAPQRAADGSGRRRRTRSRRRSKSSGRCSRARAGWTARFSSTTWSGAATRTACCFRNRK